MNRRSAWLALGALIQGACAPASKGANVADTIPDIPEDVWQAELPFSPTLQGLSPGLALRLGVGRRDGRQHLVAALRYRMPDPVVRRYRGRVDPAIFVVAVDSDRGTVFAGPCLGHDRPPAVYDAQASPAPSADGPALGGYANVDLARHLGLPPHEARYHVAAWLDEWVSEVRAFRMPADPGREASALGVAAGSEASMRPLAAEAGEAAPLSLTRAAAGRLHARWKLPEASAVVLLGYALAERRMFAAALASGAPSSALSGAVEVAVDRFVGEDTPGARAFVLIGSGQAAAQLITP